jgi:hypothetical protein
VLDQGLDDAGRRQGAAGAVEPLPLLYGRWLGELLGAGVPREDKATCSTCAMCAGPGEKPDSRSIFFDPKVKCCTYVPELPNFLVGGILNDRDEAAAHGRAAMERRLAERVAVTPLGVGKSPVYSRLYADVGDAFGRAPSMTCPYFVKEGGGCGIWRRRNSVCTTWFCKHSRGKTGRTFWRSSLQPLLESLETDLGAWCLLELDLDGPALRELVGSSTWTRAKEPLTAEALEGGVDQAAYDRLWGKWAGREGEFFTRCAELVAPLSWPEVMQIAGPGSRVLAEVTRDAFGKLTSDDLPATLKLGAMEVVRAGVETTRINTYSPFDPLDVPSVMMALLPLFDGRSPDEAINEIAERTGVRLDRALLLKMVDFGLLEAAPR